MYPKDKIVLNEDSPLVQQAVVSYFILRGIPVHANTADYDEKNLWLYWDPRGRILRRVRDYYDEAQKDFSSTNQVLLRQIRTFLELFEERVYVELNDRFSAEVLPEKGIVKVGCQDFEFDKVLELADAVRNCKK